MYGRNRRGWTLPVALGFIVASVLAVGIAWAIVGPRPPAPPEEPTPQATDVPALVVAEEALLQGDWPAAEKGYARAAAEEPGSAAAEMGWARALAFQYRYAEAVRHAHRAVELAPRGASTQATLALALNWAGEVDAAAVAARRSIDLDPQLAEAYAFLAECLVDRYEIAQARHQIERALTVDPTGVEPLRVYAYLLETEARYPEAAEAYHAAIAAAPRYAHLHFALGNVYRTLGQADNASMSYRTATNLAPGDARPLVGLGMLRMAEEDHAAAIPYLEQAVELDPDYSTAQGQLGTAYYLKGELARAREPLALAVSLERRPLPLSSYRHVLGWAFLRTGALDDAEQEFREALALNASLEGAREGLQILRALRESADR